MRNSAPFFSVLLSLTTRTEEHYILIKLIEVTHVRVDTQTHTRVTTHTCPGVPEKMCPPNGRSHTILCFYYKRFTGNTKCKRPEWNKNNVMIKYNKWIYMNRGVGERLKTKTDFKKSTTVLSVLGVTERSVRSHMTRPMYLYQERSG
jgi:hypothetical protein